MRIDIDEYQRMHDRVLPPGKRMCSGLCDLFNFGEIRDNISEMVQDRQDRDIVTMED